MKNLRLKLLVLLCAVFVVYSCNDLTVNDELLENVPELKSASVDTKSYIVVLDDAELNTELAELKGYEKKQAAVKTKTQKILKRAGISDGEIGHVYGTALKGFSVKIPPGQLKKLESDPSVKYIQHDRIISLRLPLAVIKKKPVPTPPAQTIPWGIQRVYGGSTYSGDNVAWIVDTGIDTDHPDLNVDVNRSRTFVTTEPIPTVDDLNGHGTHVAGTVAAVNDNIGVAGVAAGATVISCRVLDRSGSGSFSWSVAALDYIAGVGMAGDVVNMSLGPSSRYIDPAVDEAVQNVASLGIKISIAAGNESDDCYFYSPAHNEGTNIYTISACDINDNWAYFSNYGTPVDYCEPGYSIYSTYKDGGYATLSGTSMAAPHMAGILLWGTPAEEGTVNNDPDNNADPIGIVADGGDPNPTNNPPTANAGTDQTITADESGNASVSLDGSDSGDDNGIVSYTWSESGSTIASGVNPTVLLPVGTHTITLTVSDGEFTDSDDVIVTVNAASIPGEDVAPVISSWNWTNTSNPAMKRVQVTWSVTDENADLATVVSTLKNPNEEIVSTLTTVTGSLASGLHELSFKKGSSGTYTVTTVVTDQQGQTDTRTATIDL
uniref:S8 family serine peptidase n=1 Tax=uncultured Draconibacterium sp. TaxID=1573823 RepID=UPI0032176AD3